jgi:hypothetical protein
LSKQKAQNPILVLATLGVYFGLLMSGAAPSVLANAALTRPFDVKDEIELLDDLDTKPDDERSPVTASVQLYLEDVDFFLASLAKLNKGRRFDARVDTFNIAQNTPLPCVDSNRAGRFTPISFEVSNLSSKSALEYFSRGMVYGYSLGDNVSTGEFDASAAESKFAFSLDGKALTVNVSVKKDSNVRGVDLARDLESIARLYAAKASSKLRQAVIRNTRFISKDDQIMVVTRLPRAGLISLLSV